MMKRLVKALLLLALVLFMTVVVLKMLFPLPDISGRKIDTAISVQPETELGQLWTVAAQDKPGMTGVLALPDGVQALQSRLSLADLAESSLDVQYYIWHDDVSGNLLLDALKRASERGVKVRLLLDDNGVPGLDTTIAALNSLANFEIRLFNPSTVRNPKMLGYAFDFLRMNRRMHNKAFIADGAAAVIGGRNIGDEYFQIGAGSYYLDLDVLALGPIVSETAEAFDLYWNSASVFETETIISPETADLAAFEKAVSQAGAGPAGQLFLSNPVSATALLASNNLEIEWTRVQLVYDDPAKGEGKASRAQLLVSRLIELIGVVEQGLDLVTAYFVPGKSGTAWFAGLAAAGAEVRILTNALSTTDVAMVHSGYTKYREPLLQAGVSLFELMPKEGAPQGKEELNHFGLAGASLHAKTFAIDNKQIFIGSFNFDPRSALLNCEMGFLIDSTKLARQVSTLFETVLPTAAWQPLLADDQLTWTVLDSQGKLTTVHQEPGASSVDKFLLAILAWLPIEWML